MDTANIISLLILLSGVVTAAWTVYVALAKKIDTMEQATDARIARVYERLDENKSDVYRNFILKEVHTESQKNQDLLNDQKFLSLLKLFETNLQYLSTEVKSLVERSNRHNSGG